ncbi:cysteine hydrolase [Mesorhizobium sp. WSM4303]|uniref:cysteine hydrolase family protein n=1 Tax=unclassified Mesorhizobium TaxID=325217 RepID=UPI00115D7875|nr:MULTISPECIES: isochorismatase family cysteine hydrolase [unclassified Mesorhizobium]TRC93252.1 cysteine hydrolase [Mesorhizobium sp. WSM4306]TRD04920.1 cysteine hydrolase [Mesorhizobium sp. WSM4303]
MNRAALLVIDLQNEYRPGAAWPVAGYDAVLTNAASLIEAARAAGIPVIHAQAWVKPEERAGYARQEEIVTEEFRSAVAGSEGADICAEVAALPGDIVIHKHWPSSFRRTDLSQRLADLKIENLVVTGVLTDSCVTESVFDAVYQGFRVWLVKDACGSMSEAMHRTGMLDMANRLYGGGILRMAEALKALAGQSFDGWRCTRPVEFVYTLETVDSLYEAL